MSKTITSAEYNAWLEHSLTKGLKRSFQQSITDPENQPSQYGTVTLEMYEALEDQLAAAQEHPQPRPLVGGWVCTGSPLVAEMGLRFIFAVLFISTLSFLGLGVQPPMADWGGIVKENKEGIVYGIPAALIPAFAIATLAISVNLVADWVLNRTSSLKGGRGA